MSKSSSGTLSEKDAAYEFPSLSTLKAAHLKLLDLESTAVSPEETKVFHREIRDFMLRASATGRILDDDKERGIAQTLLNYWATVIIRTGEENIPSTSLLDLVEERGRELDESQCPYCGVDAYSEETAHLFVGRKQVILRWLEFLREKIILIVLGASGSGKTSLVGAGLLPAFRVNNSERREQWVVTEKTCQGKQSVEDLVASLEVSVETERELLVVHRLDDGLLASESKNQQRLMAAFKKWVTDAPARRKAVLVARTESAALVTQWLGEAELTEGCHQDFIPPLDARELRAVIEQPGERIGLRFEEGLVDTLINQFLGDPAAMALLQFTLIKLWEKRHRNRITRVAYHEIGGPLAIEKAAEGVYTAPDFDHEDRVIIPRIFLRLAVPGLSQALMMDKVSERDLAIAAGSEERAKRIVERFNKVGLLRIRRETKDERLIEVTHEAFLRKWPRFLQWLQDEQLHLRQRQRITVAATQWREAKYHRSALLTGIPLASALSIKDQLSRRELEFVLASKRALSRRRRRNRVVIAAIIVLLSVVAAREYYKGRETKAALSMERGERLIESGDPAGAFLFFHEAALADPDAGVHWWSRIWPALIFESRPWSGDAFAKRELHQCRLGATWWQLPRLQYLVYLQEMTHATLSADNHYLVGMSDTALQLWHLADDGTTTGLDPLRSYVPVRVNWASFNSDADQPLLAVAFMSADAAAVSGKRSAVVVFDAKSGQAVGAPIRIRDAISQKVWFSPRKSAALGGNDVDKDERLAIISQSGEVSEVSIWNFRSANRLMSLSHNLPINWAAFSSDGKLIVTAAGLLDGGDRGEAKVWDLDRNVITPLQHEGGPLGYAEFNGDGSRVVTAEGADDSNRGAARVWNVTRSQSKESGFLAVEALTVPLLHRGAVTRARFSPDGLWVATASRDRTVRLWHTRTQKQVLNFEQGGDVNDVVFSPDGRYLASGGRDRRTRIWEIATGQLAQVPLDHSETVSEVIYSNDGQLLLTTSKHLARVWAADRLEPKAPILQAPGSTVMVVSDNGQRILTAAPRPGSQNQLQLCETGGGTRLASLEFGKGERLQAASIALDSDGGRLALASNHSPGSNTVARIFEFTVGGGRPGETGQLKETVAIEEGLRGGEIVSAVFDGKRSHLALVVRKASEKLSQVMLWDFGAKTMQILPGQEPALITRLKFSPNGNYLVACFTQPPETQGRARVWALAGGAAPPSGLEHESEITTVAFSPDEQFLLSGSTDDNAKLWPIKAGRVTTGDILRENAANTHTADLVRVLFSPDGTRALTAAKDQTAILWDVTKGSKGAKRVAVLHHSAYVNDASFADNGRWIITSSGEPKLRIWSALTGELLALLEPKGEVLRVGFWPDAKMPESQSVFAISQEVTSDRDSGGAEESARSLPVPRLFHWRFAPLDVKEPDRQTIGVVLAARRLDQVALKKEETEKLAQLWESESSIYRGLFPRDSSAESSHLTTAKECELTKQFYAAAWHLTQELAKAKDDKTRADWLLQRARAYAEADNYAESLPKCIADREEAIKLGRASARDYAALADSCLDYANTFTKAEDAKDLWIKAIEALRIAVRLEPNNAEIAQQLGEVLSGGRDFKAAALEFQRAVELGNLAAAGRLALIGWLQNTAEGKADYRRRCMALADEGAPTSLLWASVVTNAFEAEPDFVAKLLRRAIPPADAAPGNFYRRNTLGAALYRAGNWERAIVELEKARSGYAAERANLLAQYYDHLIRLPISRPEEGRPEDWAFLAMANVKLKRPGEAWRWMRKLQEAPELSQAIRPVARTYPISYRNLALELLYDEASSLLQRDLPAASH